TAKHVSLDSWKALKTQCVQSLKTWRANNPSKPGADWDEDFWMTGECYPHYLSYDSYYTQGGFDSMLNFSFCNSNSFDAGASGVPGASSINETYNSYASQLNSNDNYNVLSYLSSHDTRLCRNDLIYQGSAFQLLPGGIQIYYGDESNRPLLGGLASGKDHNLRSDMNWSSLDNNVLSHWQKVGQFRNNHVAVGAGQHTNLSATSGAAFARSYSKNGVSDVVAACIGANKNTSVTITLNSTFPDGTVLKNTYDGTTAAVSGGKVTFNSGANGTILLEVADGTVPTTPTTQPTTQPTTATTAPTTPTQPATEIIGIYGDANVDKTVDINDVTAIQKQIADIATLSETGMLLADVDTNSAVNIKDATYIQKKLVGMSDIAKVGQNLVKQGPTSPATQPTQATTQATQPQEDGTVVYFENTNNWSEVYIYYWKTGSEGPNAWPGLPMEHTSDGKWKYTIPTGFDNVIFNMGSNAGQTENLTVPSTSGMTFNFSSNSWS
ncbi:MAG: starch-binding protein, partial [Ruminococcus sp.]